MHRTDLGLYLSVISHAREHEVASMRGLVGPATWYVGKGEGGRYRDAGAERVVESGGLCRSRNQALMDAAEKGLTCMELSDDLKKLEYAPDEKRANARPVTIAWVAAHILATLESTGLFLGGVAPVANAFYYSAKKPYDMKAFIVGDLCVVRPSIPPLFFDEGMRLKEDYDYSLRHIHYFGGVVRCNSVLAHFAHRTNKGGAVEYRTEALEQETIGYLKAKWPGMIRDNPKRPNEVLLVKGR